MVAGFAAAIVCGIVLSEDVYGACNSCVYEVKGCHLCIAGVKCTYESTFGRCKDIQDPDKSCSYDGDNISCGVKVKYDQDDCSGDGETTEDECTRAEAVGDACPAD